MKKKLILILIATMMLTTFLALGAAENATKSTTNKTITAPSLNVTNSSMNQATIPGSEATKSTTYKKTMALGSEATKSITNKTITTLSPEPTNTTKSITTTTTTPGFEAALNGSSSSNLSDQRLASMENWLNQPTNYFPWYSSGGSSFYSQGYSDSTFSPFREFYATTGMTIVGGIISNPTRFDIAQKTPTMIYYGVGQALPYTQYVSIVPSKTNDLWIQGATSWSQYVVSPVGTWLQLVANAPVGGSAGFYEVVQTDTTSQKYSTYQFYPGYNTMNFNADQVGRHMLYFVVNNQPSNVVIVDVFAQAQPGTMPST